MPKLLIVEDEANLSILYEREFKKEGYDVILAREGEEAILKTREYAPDLVILDIKMENMDGITAMRQMLEINRNLPIIINSAYSSFMSDFMSWAARAYVIKSSDLTELKKKVAENLKN